MRSWFETIPVPLDVFRAVKEGVQTMMPVGIKVSRGLGGAEGCLDAG